MTMKKFVHNMTHTVKFVLEIFLNPMNKSCRKTKIEEVVENIKRKQFSFELHTSECKVCIQFLKPSEDGDGAAKSDLEFHMKALKRICAICGVKQTLSIRKLKGEETYTRRKATINDLMNLNRQDTGLLPETSQICLKCRKNFVHPICKKHLSEELLFFNTVNDEIGAVQIVAYACGVRRSILVPRMCGESFM